MRPCNSVIEEGVEVNQTIWDRLRDAMWAWDPLGVEDFREYGAGEYDSLIHAAVDAVALGTEAGVIAHDLADAVAFGWLGFEDDQHDSEPVIKSLEVGALQFVQASIKILKNQTA
jgi:hypothetical protein